MLAGAPKWLVLAGVGRSTIWQHSVSVKTLGRAEGLCDAEDSDDENRET